MNELEVYCPNRDKGCEKIVTYGTVQRHKASECLYEIVPCPNLGCYAKITLGLLDKHLNDECKQTLKCLSCSKKVIVESDAHAKCINTMVNELQKVRREVEFYEKKVRSLEEKKVKLAECKTKFLEKHARSPEIEVLVPKSAQNPLEEAKATTSLANPANPAQEAEEEKKRILPDGRVICKHCGRIFNGDRIKKHEAVCQEKKAPRSTFDSTAQRLGDLPAEPAENAAAMHTAAWRVQSEGLRNAMANRNQGS